MHCENVKVKRLSMSGSSVMRAMVSNVKLLQ
jgi:hypothetical protein